MSALGAALTTWRARGGLFVVAVAALAACSNPLSDHLGYVSSLLAALVATPVAGVVGAALPAALRARGIRSTGGEVLLAAGLFATLSVVLFALVVGVHALLFTANCAPGRGAVFFILVAWPGVLLAALLGVLFGAAVSRGWLATLLSVLLLPATVAWTAVRFYRTPAVFAYDPFFGYFPGTLYDETIPLTSSLLTYRLGTLGGIVSVAALVVWQWDAESLRWCWKLRIDRVPALVTAAMGAMVSLGVYLSGPMLGHRYDPNDVARALGGRIEGRRCVVVYARGISGLDARRMRDDCELRLVQLESYFGVRVAGPVTVYLFADAGQKQRLMGAAETYIAKPWRREVYLQYQPFPHPVLKHELAHVVTGEMAPGPFRVASRWGIVPLPGLIEGAAVAAAWESESDATPHQWTRAMMEAGLAPSLGVITGLGFFTHASGTAYTAAGSFSRWLIDRYGAERYRAVYANGDFVRVYHRSLADLEREWKRFLRTVEIPERLVIRARAYFRRAPLHARVCPHETAELFERASTRLAAGDVARARDELVRVVTNDPTDVHARTALAEAWARLGDVSRATALVEQAERDLGPAAAERLRVRVADVVWRWQGMHAARPLYRLVRPDMFDEDEARTVEVKQWVLGIMGTPPPADYAQALQDLLIGRGDLPPDPLAMTARLGLVFGSGLRDAPVDPPAGYLIARQLHARERHAEAVALLQSLDLSKLPTERVRAEARRLLAVSLYLSGDRARAREIFDALARDPSRPQGLREMARDWVDRIDREMRMQPAHEHGRN